jgi:hypothetical protein
LLNVLGHEIDGYVFPAVAGEANYPIIHVAGNLKLKGSLSGKGLIYCTGDVTVVDDVTYANADSKLVVIGQNIFINDDAVGYYYALGSLSLKGKSIFGGVYAKTGITLDDNASIRFDPYIAVSPQEGSRFRLPGY